MLCLRWVKVSREVHETGIPATPDRCSPEGLMRNEAFRGSYIVPADYSRPLEYLVAVKLPLQVPRLLCGSSSFALSMPVWNCVSVRFRKKAS
jgi:hypothetical protein